MKNQEKNQMLAAKIKQLKKNSWFFATRLHQILKVRWVALARDWEKGLATLFLHAVQYPKVWHFFAGVEFLIVIKFKRNSEGNKKLYGFHHERPSIDFKQKMEVVGDFSTQYQSMSYKYDAWVTVLHSVYP